MKVRRIVTGKDSDGKSMVKWDTELESIPSRPGAERVEIWATDSLPAKLTDDDPATWELPTNLSNGSVCRVVRFEPGVAERWHFTDSVDYGIILSGELWMQLEKGEVHLHPGDIVVQRETNHNWVNRGDKDCVVVFTLISTEGGQETGW